MAAASASMLVAYKTFFIVSSCVMAPVLVNLYVTDGGASCVNPRARWMLVAEVDFSLLALPIIALFFTKEASWIKRIGYIILIAIAGSSVNCGYIAMLFCKLSPEDASKDPVYFVLAKPENGDVKMGRATRSSFVIAKVVVTALFCYLLGVLTYAYITDGFPFHTEVLTPCMICAIVDNSIHTMVYLLWIAYKESSWITAILWMIVLVFFSGFGLCAYIFKEIFSLSPEEPLSKIMFNKINRDTTSSDPLLTEHSDV